MNPSAIPLMSDAPPMPSRKNAAVPETRPDAFEEKLSEAEEAEKTEASIEAHEAQETQETQETTASPGDDPPLEEEQDPTEAPPVPPGILQMFTEPAAKPIEAPQNNLAPTQEGLSPQEISAAPLQDDGAPLEMFELEELAPQALGGEGSGTPGNTTDLSNLGGKQGSSPESPLNGAIHSFDVDGPDLDALVKPEATVEAKPEAQDIPELPVAKLRRLRVTVDKELAIEVSKQNGRIDVTADGSTQALDDLEDLGPDLAANLQELGFELGRFTQQERKGANGEASDTDESGDGKDPKRIPARKPRGGRLVNRLA